MAEQSFKEDSIYPGNSGVQPQNSPEDTAEEETFGWNFHRWSLLISFGMTLLFYILVLLFADSSNGPLGHLFFG